MLEQSLILFFATALAVFAAHYLVNGAITIAQKFNIPEFIIGAFIIGFGTSMPEFFVNIGAARNGHTDLAMTNILGSNLFNLCFSLGLLGLISCLDISQDVRLKDAPMYLIAALMIAVCGNQLYFDRINYHELMMSHGIIFLCFFTIYIYYTVLSVKKAGNDGQTINHIVHDTAEHTSVGDVIKAIVFIVLGLTGLIVGGEWIVDSAQKIAHLAGLSDKLIGLLIVGPGTSFPEFVACLLALKQKKTALIVGNIIGSNLFNIFFTLGITSLILPIPLDFELNKVVVINLVNAFILCISLWFFSKHSLNRTTSAILFVSYFGYLYIVI